MTEPAPSNAVRTSSLEQELSAWPEMLADALLGLALFALALAILRQTRPSQAHQKRTTWLLLAAGVSLGTAAATQEHPPQAAMWRVLGGGLAAIAAVFAFASRGPTAAAGPERVANKDATEHLGRATPRTSEAPSPGSDDGHVLGLDKTVTKDLVRARHDHAMVRTAAELERHNHALQDFAYLVSHDLKAPLRAISMVSEWLAEDLGERATDKIREHLETLRDRAKRMNVLIDGSLHYARANIEQGEREEVDVAGAVAEVVRLIGAGNGAVTVTTPLPKVVYDRGHMVKILMNLLSNALQHGSGSSKPVEVSADEDPAAHSVHVTDHGPGIDPRYHTELFRMFRKAPGTKSNSSGVGLAIVKLLVERHGGTVHLASRPGDGATFSFTIPKRTLTTIDPPRRSSTTP